MDKPKHLVLQEKFGQFLADNGYKLELSSVGYDGEINITVTFPDGEKLEMEDYNYDSTVKFSFHQKNYESYVQEAKLSGYSQDVIDRTKHTFWLKGEEK